jgi:hypothetical protein
MKLQNFIFGLACLSLTVVVNVSSARAYIVTDYFSGYGTLETYTGPFVNLQDSNAIMIGNIVYDSSNNSITSIHLDLYDYSKNLIRSVDSGFTFNDIFAFNYHGDQNNYQANFSYVMDGVQEQLQVSKSINPNNFSLINDSYSTPNPNPNNDPFYENFASNEVQFSATPININDATPTPIPAAAYLFGSGLVGLVGIRKKREIHSELD